MAKNCIRAFKYPDLCFFVSADYILFTDDPDEVVEFYRKKLQVL